MDNKEREWLIDTIVQGRKTQYWTVLKQAVEEWKQDEVRLLDAYKKLTIRNDKDVDIFNRACDRLVYLNKFLNINEVLIEHHKSLLEKVTDKANEIFKSTVSFVKAVSGTHESQTRKIPTFVGDIK